MARKLTRNYGAEYDVEAFMEWLREVHPFLHTAPILAPMRKWVAKSKAKRLGMSYPSYSASPRSKFDTFVARHDYVWDEWTLVQRTRKRMGIK